MTGVSGRAGGTRRRNGRRCVRRRVDRSDPAHRGAAPRTASRWLPRASIFARWSSSTRGGFSVDSFQCKVGYSVGLDATAALTTPLHCQVNLHWKLSTGNFFMTIRQDLRYAVRTLRRRPGFTIAAAVCRWRSASAPTARSSASPARCCCGRCPYADPERLVILWNRSPGLGITEDWFSTAQYFDVKTGTASFEQVAIAIGANLNLTGDGGEPERVGTIRVSSNLLPMLGAQPLMGRLLVAGDDRGRGAGRRRSGLWHLAAALRWRPRGDRPLDHPQRPSVSRSSECFLLDSTCRAR